MEFEIENLKEYKFREAKVSPIDILALSGIFNPGNFDSMRIVYKFALEHIEVEINGKWTIVKVPDREVYMPLDLENNLPALNELSMWYVNNVMSRVFPASEGLKQDA